MLIFVINKKTIMEYLNLNEIEKSCPAALTQKQSSKLSHIYRFIPTTEVIDILGEQGWVPTQAVQTKSRKGFEDKTPYKKHMIRFRNKNNDTMSKNIGDTHPEIVLTNSHDGTSSFKFHVGLFRLVCSNGLVVADKTFDQFRVMHKGFQKVEVLKAISMATEKIPQIIGSVQNMMSKELSKSQQYDFAKIAAEQRWGEDKMVDVNQMLQVRRTEDAGDDLWSVFNRVQENMLQGGILTVTPKENGKVRNSRSRAIRSIDQNLEVNKMLWTLTETMM
jgi:hypothetical protein|tara:strand:- start:2375 stop:3202 length:828 start_codon:yes stop_codon:yes gene_type:complete